MSERTWDPNLSLDSPSGRGAPDLVAGVEDPIRAEVLSPERLEQLARDLAGQHRIARQRSRLDVAARVASDGAVLKECYLTVSHALGQERAITPAARWLVDNFHVVEEQIAEITANFQQPKERGLRQLEAGPFAGYPRAFALAHYYVAHSDSHFDAGLLTRFVAAYQEHTPLEMAEIWALPVMLRVVMLENLRRIATRVARSLAARAAADLYADGLMQQLEGSQATAPRMEVPVGASRYPFILQFATRLQRLGPEAGAALSWLSGELATEGISVDDIAQREHARQGANNLTVRNLIMSLRAITAYDWRRFFDTVSLVEHALHEDPAYGDMDFLTRDRYRHSIEDLAAGAECPEVEIARAACRLASDGMARDLGYYLIADGRAQFEKLIEYRPSLGQRLRREFIAAANVAYFASVLLLTGSVAAVALWLGFKPGGTSWLAMLVLGTLALLPASDFAIGLVNQLLVRLFPPRHLPRLSLAEGIPESLRTLVVMPVMFGSEEEVEQHAAQLEVHALANPGANLCFALLSDWRDAQFETLPSDTPLLCRAGAAIAALNARHVCEEGQEPRFYLFHRWRRRNDSEDCWMGWERKRGKLYELNRLLRGATDTSFITLEDKRIAVPHAIRYVVTLDADTRVPMGGVAKLVGTAAHPRNQPHFDQREQRVVQGYGVLQPRVTPLLPGRDERSFYREMITGASGLDPYAGAVSDVYQDIFGQGIFTGKGLYDVDMFMRALAGRVPENSLLSHDLFEGIFARCALVSDAEFFEEFPSHSEVAAGRGHRWTRGDWQLLPWLLGLRGTGLPALGRWQLFDNIRRSLSAPAALALLIAACASSNSRVWVWLALVMLPLVAPSLLRAGARLVERSRNGSRADTFRMVGVDLAADLGRAVMSLALLAQNAWLMIDAIGRALTRMLVTHRRLLEWVTAAQMKASSGSRYALQEFAWPLKSSSIVVIGGVLVLLLANPLGLRAAAPLLMLWWLAPVLARALSVPREHPEPSEEPEPRNIGPLREIARRTWCFFETFVGAEDNHLPPDNFQEDPRPVVAYRSSPTNFGLYLLSSLSARDFGWLGSLDLCARLQATLTTFGKLERCNGHFLNWYQTRTLASLEPRYVSTVDSGNLAGHLLALSRASQGLQREAVVRPAMLQGPQDTLRIAIAALEQIDERRRSSVVSSTELRASAQALQKRLAEPCADAHLLAARIAELRVAVHGLADMVQAFSAERGESDSPLQRWVQCVLRDIESQQRDLAALLPWTQKPLPELPATTRALLVAAAAEPLHALPRRLRAIAAGLDDSLSMLRTDLLDGAAQCEALGATLDQIGETCERYFDAMQFGFLFDRNRHLFSIGYRVRDGLLDEGSYDLLASEARLASLVAIAKGDVPRSHWFRLGRRLAGSTGGPLLLSWSGSMFEYLMPALVMKSPRDSLLDQTCRRVVHRQIEYGNERGVPWGVSESALNVRDRELTYQYSDFGVPGLGLKRGLRNNLVIAPYATALAAMFAPNAALENFRRLAGRGALGQYGYFEALDFTASRLEGNQEVAVVKAYMAHHQGMSLVSLANSLLDGIMQQRFHEQPRIKAAELLLQEQGARRLSVPRLVGDDSPQQSFSEPPPDFERRFTSPASSAPATLLLSNRHYSVMITAAGGGLSTCDGRAVTRWREDMTRDCWGSFFYVRDVETGRTHCAGYQPCLSPPDRYEALLTEDRATLRRRDGALDTTLEVLISPEDNAELRRVTLGNQGARDRQFDITSYAELVLAPLAADIAHPAFSNLFVQTEYVAELGCLLAMRRPRSAHDPQVWAAQVIAGVRSPTQRLEFETDRARFVGRGRSVREPIAVMDGRPLSNTVGPVLDPIFSLRTRVLVKAGAETAVTFVTLMAGSREQALALAEKYANAGIFERVATLSWTFARAELYHMRIEPAEARLFQALASHLLYANRELRLADDLMSANVLSASGLWRFGISGDRAIVAVRCESQDEREFLQQLLRAQEYWRNKRLLVDVVVINERAYSYVEDLQRELEEMARGATVHLGSEERSGVYILRRDQINAAEYVLLLTAARVVLRPGQGSLAEQILRPAPEPAAETTLLPAPAPNSVAAPIELPTLELFNGLGGFADDGREYVIALESQQQTPAPWVNVIANPEAGFIVSETGSSCTWAGNSRENQLTPWSNDPVIDPSGEAFFLRDEDDGAVWSPTAQPIRLPEARYLTRHGQGYSRFQLVAGNIETDLHLFVAEEDPVKIASLRITNHGRDRRRISVTAYVEWMLGDQRGKHAPYIITEMDASGAMLVRNPWNVEFGQRVGFADLGGRQQSWTGSRREFIGRNGALSAPRAMRRDLQLSGRVGAGLDPCCAMRTALVLEAGATEEVVFVLGQADDVDAARALVMRYRHFEASNELRAVKVRWQRLLDTLQVRTPDRALDLLVNRWLPYQTLSCRFWGRAAFYQAGGAYGFRDQLQDSMLLVSFAPELARDQLLRAGGRQFVEGDVQHWWHPPTGRGVRTRFSDDRVWLPYVALHYLDVTGDRAVLDESLPFLEGMQLQPEQEDAHFQPQTSEQCATLYEHCARALDISLANGAHGLPLIGAGDWNDGMNRVGQHGKGESVWLAWFLVAVLRGFAPVAQLRGEQARARTWLAHADALLRSIEEQAWDGQWYRRAFFDDGTPLGSAANTECRIDSIAQSWAVLSGAGERVRAERAMDSLKRHLVRPEDELVLLFTPPFDHAPQDPGYIKGYLPGLRENGGQYTHAAVWAVIASAMLGRRQDAAEMFDMLNPVRRTTSRTGVLAYKVEPYVLAADVYSQSPHARRGGWTWYTGSASWMYRAATEWLLGMRLRPGRIEFQPCVRPEWRSYHLRYRSGKNDYLIRVESPVGGSGRLARIEMDGVGVTGTSVPLLADDRPHEVRIWLD